MVSPAQLLEHVEHFQRRVLQDALNEACAGYWRRRARQFAAVGTPACDEIAKACWARSHVALLDDAGEDLLLEDHLGRPGEDHLDRGVQ